MQNIETFENWIVGKYKTQGAFADALGVGQTTVSRWLAGKQKISADYRQQIKKAGFKGKLPEPAAEITREDLEALGGDLVRAVNQSEGRLSKEIQTLGAILHRIQVLLERPSNNL